MAEIILCCKEVNTKTRATAFELLVEVGHAMHAARPPTTMPPLDDAMGAQSVSDGPCCCRLRVLCYIRPSELAPTSDRVEETVVTSCRVDGTFAGFHEAPRRSCTHMSCMEL